MEREQDEREHEAEILAEAAELQTEVAEEYERKMEEYRRNLEEWRSWRRKQVPECTAGVNLKGDSCLFIYRRSLLESREEEAKEEKTAF